MINELLFLGQLSSLILGLWKLFENAIPIAFAFVVLIYVLEAFKIEKGDSPKTNQA